MPPTLLWFALLAVVVWLPLPLGSNRPWSGALLIALSFGLVSLWAIRYAIAPYRLPPALRLARPALLWGWAWVSYGLLQTLPLPSIWVAGLNPSAYQLYQTAYSALNLPMPTWLPLSVNVAATAWATAQATAYLILFFLVLVLAHDTQRFKTLALTFLTVAACNATYGLLVAFEGADSALRITPYLGHSMVSGTYVNRNHFAGLMILILPLGMALLRIQADTEMRAASWRGHWADALHFSLDAGGRLLLLCLLIMLGLIFSNSRGGLLALGLAFIFLAIRLRRHHITNVALPWIAGGIFLSLLLLWLGDGGLSERFSQQGFTDSQRPLLWANALSYSREFWLTGSGAGTFAEVFPAYKSAALGTALFEHAHNDYLETLAESGLIGTLLLLGFLVSALRVILRPNRRHLTVYYLALGSLAGITALLIHGFVDFNLRIPANAAYFYLLLGLGVAAAGQSHAQHRA